MDVITHDRWDSSSYVPFLARNLTLSMFSLYKATRRNRTKKKAKTVLLPISPAVEHDCAPQDSIFASVHDLYNYDSIGFESPI